ncbi:MAG: hypothetical protein O2840_04610 [bacterium]|nr:hypothetical protein [bacterium]
MPEHEDRILEKRQVALILSKKKMAAEMAVILESDVRLKTELNNALHGSGEREGLGYRQLIYWYFFESERNISEVVIGLFIAAYLKTSLVRPEERILFEEVLSLFAQLGEVPSNVLDDFMSFVEERIDLFEGALHYLINDYDLLDKLSPAEFRRRRQQNRVRHLQRWIEENPDEVARLNRDRMVGREEQQKWSPQMRRILQGYFDAGYSYVEAVAALQEHHGITTTIRAMTQMIYKYPDLVYRKPELDRAKRDEFDAQVLRVFHESSKNRSLVYAHFALQGYKRRTVKAALQRLAV